MAYVSVPKDLTKVKNKLVFNLTRRQLICFALAAAIGLPFYFLTRETLGTTTSATCMDAKQSVLLKWFGDKYMVASGVDIKTTQALMGHSTPEMTLKVYAKKEESRLPDAMRKMESFLAGNATF